MGDRGRNIKITYPFQVNAFPYTGSSRKEDSIKFGF